MGFENKSVCDLELDFCWFPLSFWFHFIIFYISHSNSISEK